MHKAALLIDFGKPLQIGHISTPTVKDYEVLVKVVGAGICHTDIHVWKGERKAAGIPPRLPFILSHEISGVVVAKGDKVPEIIKEGQKVLVYPWQWREEDKYTMKGLHLADKPAWLGMYVDGGLQEYVLVGHYKFLVDANGLEDLPAASTLGCAGLTTYRAVKKIVPYLEPDDYVAIVGVGGLGVYAAQWLKTLAPHVNTVFVDIRDQAIEFASKIVKPYAVVNVSKEEPIQALYRVTKNLGIKAVLDFVGTENTINTYANVLSKCGIYVVVGMMGNKITITPLRPFVVNEKTLTGVLTGTLSEFYEVVTLAKRGMVDYASVVSRRFNLEEVNKIFEAFEKGEVVGRYIVVF